MTRSGWNPGRRNRNIGTAARGHGQDNRLVIPQRWSDERVFWEKLTDPVAVHAGGLVVLVEPVLAGYTHACTPDDVLAVLRQVPEDLGDLRTFALRQPTRKQAVLQPVWGRLAYYAEIGPHRGPVVFLEAQEVGREVRQGTSMSVEEQREFDRLIADGHRPMKDARAFRWELTLEATRATQLYRTLLHEIGHQVDYMRSVEVPGRQLGRDPDDVEWDAIMTRYRVKSSREKEAFAHRFADELGERLRQSGAFPFQRLADPGGLRSQGLNPAWFGVQPA